MCMGSCILSLFFQCRLKMSAHDIQCCVWNFLMTIEKITLYDDMSGLLQH